jgi:hypothetical protein
MSKGKRALFIILLVAFIGASVTMSFNMISRPTFEFEYIENYNDTGLTGYVFNGFNGNSKTETVNIDHPYVKSGGEWIQDESKDVVAVDGYTFVSDEYVKYINIGPQVEYIDEQAFVYCKQLREIRVDEANPNYCDVDGVLYTKDMKTIILYPICRCTHLMYDDIEKYGDVKNIGLDYKETFEVKGANDDEMFTDIHKQIRNTNGDDFTRALYDEMLERGVAAPYIGTYYVIKEKTATSMKVEKAWSCDEKYAIPGGVERIAGNCFYKCDRLGSIDIPDTVKYIGNMAFFKCYGTSLLRLPDSLEYIGNDAFSYCENMRYAVFIPAGVKHIGHHAFYKCSNDLLYYMGSESGEGIELGGRWQARSDNSFEAEPPYWGKTRQECDEYNQRRFDEDAKAVAEAEKNDQGASSASAGEVDTGFIKIIMIFFFIPGFLYIGVQVIRAMFKEDFLMTKRGKRKLAAIKAEREKIHQAYVQAGSKDSGDDDEAPQGEEAEDAPETPAEENEEGGDE